MFLDPSRKHAAFGRLRVVVCTHVCMCSQALFSMLFWENVGATWLYLYTRAQFYITKQIIDKVEQDLSHFPPESVTLTRSLYTLKLPAVPLAVPQISTIDHK